MRYLTVLLAACLSVASFAFDVPCLDPLACNFMEEGECFFTDENGDPCVIEGCTIEGACNYDPEADIYDGSCEFESCLGCTDAEACNYDETALYDDATCIYYVDCNGTCGGDWIEDACGTCYSPDLYSASFDMTFTTCGQIGPYGPSQAACDEEYGYGVVNLSDGIQSWIVPHSGNYTIEVLGAASIGQTHEEPFTDRFGKGAKMKGDFELTQGDTLQILVGQMPIQSNFNGGGGGTFVAIGSSYMSATPLIVAGGGGSYRCGYDYSGDFQSILDGTLDLSGVSSYHSGGFPGQGAIGCLSDQGGGGGGFYSDAEECVGDAAKAFVNGGRGGIYNYEGGQHGGFGGGGMGGWGGSGGGGGYSGGGAPANNNFPPAGGGGSYNSGDNQDNTSGMNVNEGIVFITFNGSLAPFCNPGCTYAQACNYNPESNFDDGSCDYCFCGEGTQWVDSLQACMVTEAALMQACGEGTYWDDLAQACLTIETCQEDLDGDGVVGVNDLLELLSSFGSECVPEPETAEWTCGDSVNYHGYDYATVQIGEQCWFAENLRNTAYSNGDELPTNLDSEEWHSSNYGAYTIYQGDISNVEQFGLLYNFHAGVDDRGLCPSGWHVPSDEDFKVAEVSLGMTEADANASGWRGSQGMLMKSSDADVPSWDGSNSSGFSALPGGSTSYAGTSMPEDPALVHPMYTQGAYWTSTFNGGDNAMYRGFYSDTNGVYRSGTANGYSYDSGMSVRCVQDSE